MERESQPVIQMLSFFVIVIREENGYNDRKTKLYPYNTEKGEQGS